MTSTNYPGGVTNVIDYKMWGNYLAPAPSVLYSFYYDFFAWVPSAANWVVTEDETAAISILDAAGGVLSIVNDGADDDHVYVQWFAEICAFVAGKEAWYEARFQISSATESDLFMGLYVRDTDPVGGITDGVYFHKPDGGTTLNLVVVNGSTATTTAVTTVLAASTWYSAGLYYNGSDRIDIFLNGDKVAECVTTNLPPDELTPSFAIQNGSGAAVTLLLDYIAASFAR